MEFLKNLFKDDVAAVGLSKYRQHTSYKDSDDFVYIPKPVKFTQNKPAFTPNYSNNFFLL